MLSIYDPQPARNCQGFQRREFLRIGGAGMLGLSLPGLVGRSAWSNEGLRNYVTGKSVVFLFLGGGPSHIELFDPKPTAPSEFRSITGETPTVHPGVSFGGTFPQLASLADKFSIVRSFQSKNGGHEYVAVTTARNPTEATLGALYTRVTGVNHPQTGAPLHTLVLPEAVAPDGFPIGRNFETGHLPGLSQPGSLGSNFQAFSPSGGGPLKQNMEMAIPADRFRDRRQVLSQLDRLRRRMDSDGRIDTLDKMQQQAYDVITGGVAQAFDLNQENPKTVAAYDTSHCFKNAEVQRWGDMRRSTNLLGRQMLLARRLVESGCGFVTVSDCGWDMHSNGNSPKGLGGMNWLGPQVDHAVAAFIRDCEDRGLSDKVLLVVTGEMGRTPRINNNGGRDHYGELTPLLLYGGGLRMGQVVGQSDSNASRPATEPYNPGHLLSTIMHTLFDLGQLRLDQSLPRDVAAAIQSGEPILPLMA
ncbi:DUF1501 domain-containing protein [Lignipirellula cremea]|uniref:DUF1501 domain-containing protein n=1 Tax=Lignipirellula cremea TaxID=2528010 RepID=A0A518DNT1_9BACT|nr:DUF1501 domain-containing protein [Lignipirellula cremea]QDU93463.1 hypothetical protein Pla8534_12430 [Lignipirellula cremea]